MSTIDSYASIVGVLGHPLPIIMEIFRIENGRVAEVWDAGTLRQSDTYASAYHVARKISWSRTLPR
jgi:hypothetical protein